MHAIVRASLIATLLIAGSSGCSSLKWNPDSALSSVQRIDTPVYTPPSPSKPAPAGLDDYKTQVARHVVEHNPERTYSGTLPPLLPAIVVLQITVDGNGELAGVEVQRSRNAAASEVALASMRRSTPLPRPQQLAQATGRLTFSETFLFADGERYQLRSLAASQASE